uniref:NADH-ubiquinone oxidoreductase chain 5 n=1 Tax=Batillaria attramentaria TaxID=370345 RepID=A0A6G8FEE5_9CAEN|nr:NADH dehydrogenase subunit 5 [Batillaria attramentaria]QIM14725.1 NADH dehydrogenase subunit 5 [Batillaria attramentaria]
MFKALKSSSISSIFLLAYSFSLFPLTCYFMTKDISILYEWSLLEVSSCYMTAMFILDPLSLSFSNVVCLISGSVMAFSSSYMSADPFLKRFTWLVMLFVLSMNFLVFIPSLPALLLGWDGLGIVSFALVIYYQNTKSLGAGMLTVLANRVGDVMILLSIAMLVLTGYWSVMISWDFYLSSWLALSIMIAGMTKSAQIPFSAWLPAAMAAPTPVSALVHSSTLVTAGVFLLIRFYSSLILWDFFKPSLLLISVLTLLMAGIGANYENDLKKVIALSTLSQLGVMMMALAMGTTHLALFHLYTHALFKALLFLCAGAIIHASSNNQDVRYSGLMYKHLPFTVTCMNVANLSLCGAPFLSGFYSKDLILELSLAAPTSGIIVFLIFLATGMTSAYSLRLSFSTLWGPMQGNPLHAKAENDPYINFSTAVLSLFAIFGGALLQSIFIPFNPAPFFLPKMHKGLTMFVILLGLLLAAHIWDADFNTKSPKKSKNFFNTMWMLAPLSSQPLTKFSMLLGTNMMKSIDQGWLEVAGGQGTVQLASSISKQGQSIQVSLFTFFVFLILMGALLFTSVLFF